VDPASYQVVQRRVRNRLIEYFEMAASFDEQSKYQLEAPQVHVPHEVINQYEDWVPSPSRLDEWGPPVFSMGELDALREFARVFDDTCDRTPHPLPPLDQVQRLPAWESLRQGARDALRVFLRRGKLEEGADGLLDV
tara:strand:+ start:454 stop:864 length:411 start_codon:yes stop_codon:yes gene_type:complete